MRYKYAFFSCLACEELKMLTGRGEERETSRQSQTETNKEAKD